MADFSAAFLQSLERISQSAAPPDVPDPLSQAQTNVLEKERAKYYKKNQKAQLKNFKQDIRMRREYADRIYNMLGFWLMFTGGILFLVALGKLSVSENVLIALLTTSSANVIAIFIYVVKYLYAKPGMPEDSSK